MRKFTSFIILVFTFGCADPGNTFNSTTGGGAAEPSPIARSGHAATPMPKPAPPDEEAELVADFEGTSGTVDKKYDLKGVAVLADVRTGRHSGFDRIVFEFRSDEMPDYHLEYIDEPVRACGSGNVVPLPGDGWLQIRFEPAVAHTEAGNPTLAFRELAPNLPNVIELKSTCDLEAQVEWVAGVASPNRYRVVELKASTRLAVDIKHK